MKRETCTCMYVSMSCILLLSSKFFKAQIHFFSFAGGYPYLIVVLFFVLLLLLLLCPS